MAILKDLIVLGNSRITSDLYAKTIFEDNVSLSAKYAPINHTHSQYLTGQDHYSSGITAQTTQALYPIKISASGHITAYGSAVTSLPASDVYAWAKASTKPSYNLDEVSDGSTRKLANYLPLGGGTLTGLLKWNNGNALPQQTSPQYMLCIDAFSNGGTTKWCELSDLRKSLNLFATEYSTSGSTASFYFDDTIRKMGCTKTDQNWNAQIYSNTGYVNDIVLTYKASQTDKYIMFGLDSNPTESANYNTIDYCWYIQSGGGLCMYENGTQINSISGHTSYAVGDELRIEYRDGNVLYYHNNVVCRTVARAVSGKLYIDSSFYNGGYVYDVWFGPSIHYTPSAFAAASHTHNYAGSSSVGGAATTVSIITDSNADSSYRMVWHSGSSLYSTDNIYCNPSTDTLYSKYLNISGTSTAFSTPIATVSNTSDSSWLATGSFLSPNITSGHYNAIQIGKSMDQGNVGHLSFYYDGSDSANNRFAMGFYNYVDLFVVKRNGNVGVGTANPSKKLDVNGDTNINGNLYGTTYRLGQNVVTTRACLLLNSPANTPADIIFRSGSYTGSTWGDWAISSRGNQSSDGNGKNSFCIARGASNSGLSSEAVCLKIHHNNTVIIGQDIFSTTPAHQLHVVGGTYSSTYMQSGTYMNAGTYVRASGNDIYAGASSGSQCHMQYDNSNECMKFLFD